MKSSAIRSNINIGFDELEYKILNEFLKTPPEDFAGQEDLPSSEEENYGDDFEKELEVPYETFNTKTSEIIQKIHHYLKSNNTTLHQIFEGHIFTHNLDDANSYDAILLDNFINVLDSLGIKLEMIEKYCIFAKLCKTESIETIDFSKLCNEITSFESNEKKIEMEEIKEMNEDLTNPIDDY